MAKEPKAKRALIPAHLRKPVLMAAGAVVLLFGALLLWQGWRAMNQDALAPRLQALRDGLVKQIDEAIAAHRGRFGAALADTYVQADLSAGANADAAKRVRESWPELSAMEFFDPELDAPLTPANDGSERRACRTPGGRQLVVERCGKVRDLDAVACGTGLCAHVRAVEEQVVVGARGLEGARPARFDQPHSFD